MRNHPVATGAALATVCVLLWFPLWTGEQTVFAIDAASYFYPMKAALARMVQSGEWPWWNPWLRNGLPFYANPQVGLFYPPTVLFYFLPVSLAFNWVIILHFALLAVGFFAWLRRSGHSDLAAGVGALAVAWGGFAISMTTYLNNLQAIAWVGWTWWAWTAWLEGRKVRWLALTAVGFAFQFLAGEPQVAAITAVIALLIAWTRSRTAADEPLPWWEPLLALGAAALGAILLTAVQLIPTAELFLLSGRSEGLRPNEILAWSLHPSQLHNLLVPRYYEGSEGLFDLRQLPISTQPWVFTSYLGVGVVLLAAAGFDRRRTVWSLLWAGLAILGVLLAIGAHNPLVTLLLDVPLLRIFRYPEKMLLLPAIAIPVLAAAGLDRVRSGAAGTRAVAWAALLVFVGMLAAWMLTRAGALDEPLRWLSPEATVSSEWIVDGFAHGFRHVAVFAGLIAFLLVLKSYARPSARAMMIGVVAVADLATVNPGAVGLAPARLLGQWPTVLEGLPLDDLRTSARIRTSPLGRGSSGWFMIRDISVAAQHYFLFHTMGPNLSMVHGILAQGGIEAFRPRSDDAQLEILQVLPLELQVRYLRLQSTHWLAHWPLDVEGLEHVPAKPVYRLERYRITDPLPRAYMVDRIAVEPDSVEVLNRFLAGGEDPHRVAYVSEGNGLPGSGERVEGDVEWLPGTNHSVRLRVQAPRRVLLVLTDTWYPGWRATVDGEPVPVERVNWHFRGVYLDAGAHDVHFDYSPRGLGAAAIVSLLSLTVLGFLIAKGGGRGA
ncbi:MAG TPA: YfhO family protein [Gemmatimonadota bacterium]|nr:YfhO family protein [Gemmatimonadota bacterium]